MTSQSNMPSQSTMTPTYEGGIIFNTWDAYVIFINCIEGRLNHVARRPADKEREASIVSGNIFCYEENASGIKRWTDGVTWSPSRILSNCLVYRELSMNFPPGEKKKALKRGRRTGTAVGINRHGNSLATQQGTQSYRAAAIAAQAARSYQNGGDNSNDPDRMFLGSLLDSYPFKEDGLVKKTISFTMNGVTHHIVNYYTLDDAKTGRLSQPSLDQRLNREVNWDIISQQNFRSPIDNELPLGADFGGTFVHPQPSPQQAQHHNMIPMAPARTYVTLPPHAHPYGPPGQHMPMPYFGEEQRQSQQQHQQQHHIFPLNDPTFNTYYHNPYPHDPNAPNAPG